MLALEATPRAARCAQALDLPAAFGRIGGVMTGDDLALVLSESDERPLSRVAQWIARRQVVNFMWRTQFLFPIFQFDPDSMTPHTTVRSVIAELAGAFDDFDIAAWFAHPNAWLGGESPANVIGRDGRAVLEAARADRFLATSA